MLKKTKWFWEAYFIFYTVLNLRSTFEFFLPHSDVFFYYYFLCAFNKLHFFSYTLNLLQIVFNLLHCFPLGFYIYNIFWLKPKFWQYLFMMKIVLDVTGHSYENQYLLSLWHGDPKIALLVFLQGLIFQIPIYIACYRYAFKKS